MTNTTEATATTDQLGVTTTSMRADQLRLGDVVLTATWKGTVLLETVTSLALVGDDVELTSDKSSDTLMSRSTQVTVVSARAL